MLGVEDREKTHDGLFCLQNEVVNGFHGYYIYFYMLLTFSLHCTDTGKYLGLFTYIYEELEWAGGTIILKLSLSIFTMPGLIYFNRNILVKCNVDMRLYVFL